MLPASPISTPRGLGRCTPRQLIASPAMGLGHRHHTEYLLCCLRGCTTMHLTDSLLRRLGGYIVVHLADSLAQWLGRCSPHRLVASLARGIRCHPPRRVITSSPRWLHRRAPRSLVTLSPRGLHRRAPRWLAASSARGMGHRLPRWLVASPARGLGRCPHCRLVASLARGLGYRPPRSVITSLPQGLHCRVPRWHAASPARGLHRCAPRRISTSSPWGCIAVRIADSLLHRLEAGSSPASPTCCFVDSGRLRHRLVNSGPQTFKLIVSQVNLNLGGYTQWMQRRNKIALKSIKQSINMIHFWSLESITLKNWLEHPLGAPSLDPIDAKVEQSCTQNKAYNSQKTWLIFGVSSQLPSKIGLSLRGLWEIDICRVLMSTETQFWLTRGQPRTGDAVLTCLRPTSDGCCSSDSFEANLGREKQF
jgi:hypothetical protein